MSAAAPVLGWYRLAMRLNRYFWGMTLFGGIGLPLIIQAAFGQRLDGAGRTRLLIGNVVLGLAMVVLRRVSFGLVTDRLFGHRDLVATTALTRGGYLLAYAAEALTVALLPLCVVALAALLPGVTPPSSWEWLVPYALLAASLFALGVVFGSVANSVPAVSLLANVATLVVVAFCPVSYAAERVPDLLRPLVTLLPPSLAAERMAALWDGGALAGGAVALLAAWAAGLLALAWRLLPWTDRE